jgi:hypothetical protein
VQIYRIDELGRELTTRRDGGKNAGFDVQKGHANIPCRDLRKIGFLL